MAMPKVVAGGAV